MEGPEALFAQNPDVFVAGDLFALLAGGDQNAGPLQNPDVFVAGDLFWYPVEDRPDNGCP
jgi:hypothetical protein